MNPNFSSSRFSIPDPNTYEKNYSTPIMKRDVSNRAPEIASNSAREKLKGVNPHTTDPRHGF